MSEKIIYAILGPGVSGEGAAKLLSEHQSKFIVIGNEDPEDWRGKFDFSSGKAICLHENDKHIDLYFEGLEILVLSPGIPLSHPLVQRFRDSGKEVLNEIDLGYRYWSTKKKTRCLYWSDRVKW